MKKNFILIIIYLNVNASKSLSDTRVPVNQRHFKRGSGAY